MNRKLWSRPISPEEAYKRASGRRHYNSIRHLHVILRRLEVAKCLRQGFRQCDIAEALGVHPATICRDVVAIYAVGARHPMLP